MFFICLLLGWRSIESNIWCLLDRQGIPDPSHISCPHILARSLQDTYLTSFRKLLHQGPPSPTESQNPLSKKIQNPFWWFRLMICTLFLFFLPVLFWSLFLVPLFWSYHFLFCLPFCSFHLFCFFPCFLSCFQQSKKENKEWKKQKDWEGFCGKVFVSLSGFSLAKPLSWDKTETLKN